MKKLFPFLSLFLFSAGAIDAQTWTKITVPTTADISSCFFINANTGWMTTYNTIYKTTDGGVSWNVQNHPGYTTPIEEFFFRIQFVNENVGIIAVGNYIFVGGNPAEAGSVLWTTNGGETWTYKNTGAPNMNEPDVSLVNEFTAYCIGDYGLGTKTTDGGTTWNTINYDSDVAIQKCIAIDENTVYFAGAKGNFGATSGVVGMTSSSGSIWNIEPVSANESMESIYFEDAFHGWIGGYNGEIKRTSDGGTNWSSSNTGVTSVIKDIRFSDNMKGWAVTDDGKVIHSYDGGINWSEEYQGIYALNSVSFTNPDYAGYAVGEHGTFLKYNPNLSIEANVPATDFALYPNPTNNNLTIEFKSDTVVHSISLYNTICQLVLAVPPANLGKSTAIDISTLAKGVYHVEIKSDKGKMMKKFIKS